MKSYVGSTKTQDQGSSGTAESNPSGNGCQNGGAITHVHQVGERPSNPAWVCAGSIEYSVGCHPGQEKEVGEDIDAGAPPQEVRYVNLVDHLSAMLEGMDRARQRGQKPNYQGRAERLLGEIADEWNQNGHLMSWVWYHGYGKAGDLFTIAETERERRAA